MKKLKAYHEEWVNNKYILNQMERWQNLGLLSSQKLTLAKEKLIIGYKEYNIFAKIGLFIFSWIALSSITSMIGISILDSIDRNELFGKIVMIVASIIHFIMLEIIIGKGKFYRSGPDNLVLYTATGSTILSLILIGGLDFDLSIYFLFSTLVLAFVTIRYGDPFISLCLFISFTGLVFVLVTKSETGKVVIPFVLMALAAVLFFANNKWVNSIYYHTSQKVFKACALVLFYLGGNYLVVREGNALLASLTDSVEIPFNWIFWVLTFLIPVVYLGFSLRSKDRLMLHLSILGMGASLATYRFYNDETPMEHIGCIIGAVLIVSTILLSRWLKKERNGITSQPTKGDKNKEALIINEVIQSKLGDGPSQDGVNFGGGSFGGGGAGSGY